MASLSGLTWCRCWSKATASVLTVKCLQVLGFDENFTLAVQQEMAKRGGGYDKLRRMRAGGKIAPYMNEPAFMMRGPSGKRQAPFDLETGLVGHRDGGWSNT
jgi:hypothetical protein